VTAYIAEELGTTPGGSGTTFDTLYRQRLRQTGLSDSEYRDLSRASLANDKLIEELETALGDTGEHVTLRAIIVQTQEEAQAALDRVKGGEDMGTVAQEVSADLTSKQEDGLLPATPRDLFPEAVETAIADQDEGALLGPVEVNNGWWVVRVETIDPDATYTDAIKTQLAGLQLTDMLNEAKTGADIERSLSDGDIEWAYRHLPSQGG
jgi:peptidyl-prolyl cis-trans isomerase C